MKSKDMGNVWISVKCLDPDWEIDKYDGSMRCRKCGEVIPIEYMTSLCDQFLSIFGRAVTLL